MVTDSSDFSNFLLKVKVSLLKTVQLFLKGKILHVSNLDQTALQTVQYQGFGEIDVMDCKCFAVKVTAQKIKFSVKDFFSKCDQTRSNLRIWSHLLKKLLMENFIFCAVC